MPPPFLFLKFTVILVELVSGWQIGEKSVLGGIFRISPVLGGTAKIFPTNY
jgi:hypothetical protein